MSSWAGDGLSAQYWLGDYLQQWPLTASEVTHTIGPPVLDAIAAVIPSDWLTHEEYYTLFDPWDVAIDSRDEEQGGPLDG